MKHGGKTAISHQDSNWEPLAFLGTRSAIELSDHSCLVHCAVLVGRPLRWRREVFSRPSHIMAPFWDLRCTTRPVLFPGTLVQESMNENCTR